MAEGEGRKAVPVIPDIRVRYRLSGQEQASDVQITLVTLSAFETEFEEPYTVITEVEGRLKHVPWLVWHQRYASDVPTLVGFLERIEECYLLTPEPSDSPLASMTLAEAAMVRSQAIAVRTVLSQGS